MGPTGTSSAPHEPAVLPSAFWGPRVKPCTASGCLQRTLGGVGGGWEDGDKHGANVSQPEPQNCDPPRRELLEEKEKKKVNRLLRDCDFCVHMSHKAPGQAAVFRALRFQFCSM